MNPLYGLTELIQPIIMALDMATWHPYEIRLRKTRGELEAFVWSGNRDKPEIYYVIYWPNGNIIKRYQVDRCLLSE